MEKFFIITVDTEGDNCWESAFQGVAATRNTSFIPRFQNLCEEYGFKPVYLTNYEMVSDSEWVRYARSKMLQDKCEIGMHLHAWNTPPYYNLSNRFGGNPYITEYPYEIMEQKVQTMKALLEKKFETRMVSHRSGRWATNPTYFEILKKYGIQVDCSVTPQVDLSKLPGYSQNCGNDYRKFPTGMYEIYDGILEVPMTTRVQHYTNQGNYKHRLKALIKGEPLWLRPLKNDPQKLIELTQKVEREKNHKYLEFMIHSSELMPGGSPYFKDEAAVEKLYGTIRTYFEYVANCGYKAVMLKELV